VALEHGKIPTTSGSATGSAPAASKLTAISTTIGVNAPVPE